MSEMKRVSSWKRTEIRMVGKGRRGDSSGHTQRKDNIRMYVHTYVQCDYSAGDKREDTTGGKRRNGATDKN